MNHQYNGNPRQCLEMIISSASTTRFSESIDVAVNLGIDSSQSNNQVKGIVIFPNGIGRDIKVAVFTQGNFLLEAEKSGADIVGDYNLVEEVKNGKKLKVDWCIATADFMVKITPIAKILSINGLMPNSRFGTITSKITETVKTIKSGQVRFKTDKNGIIHSKLGNTKFSVDHLLENLKALLKVIKNSKPTSFKGLYFKSIFLSSTMGKAYKINKLEDII